MTLMDDSVMDALREQYPVFDSILKNAAWDGSAGQAEAWRMFKALWAANAVLRFADGAVLASNRLFGDFPFVLADLYAGDCEWAQDALRLAGCHRRGRFLTDESPVSPDPLGTDG